MNGFEGSLALKLDFGDSASRVTSTGGRGKAGLRLATAAIQASGPEKYRMLELRRRAAQIRARRLLDLMDHRR